MSNTAENTIFISTLVNGNLVRKKFKYSALSDLDGIVLKNVKDGEVILKSYEFDKSNEINIANIPIVNQINIDFAKLKGWKNVVIYNKDGEILLRRTTVDSHIKIDAGDVFEEIAYLKIHNEDKLFLKKL